MRKPRSLGRLPQLVATTTRPSSSTPATLGIVSAFRQVLEAGVRWRLMRSNPVRASRVRTGSCGGRRLSHSRSPGWTGSTRSSGRGTAPFGVRSGRPHCGLRSGSRSNGGTCSVPTGPLSSDTRPSGHQAVWEDGREPALRKWLNQGILEPWARRDSNPRPEASKRIPRAVTLASARRQTTREPSRYAGLRPVEPLGSTKPFRVSSKRLCHECATRVPFSTSFLSTPAERHTRRHRSGILTLV
jgi:hypothetical protein